MTKTNLPVPLKLIYAVAPVALAGLFGNLATLPNIPNWYAALAKPAFNPPNWVFGPVWTCLYIVMAVAFYRILSLPPSPARHRALAAFLVQTVLNGLWSWAFFADHNPLAGLIVIIVLIAAIVSTILTFIVLDRFAGWSLLPYLCWVLFAMVLNFSIWQLN